MTILACKSEPLGKTIVFLFIIVIIRFNMFLQFQNYFLLYRSMILTVPYINLPSSLILL